MGCMHRMQKYGPPIDVQRMSMCSSNSEEVVEALDSHDLEEGHDALYPMTCTPAYLGPRLTLLVHASTIMLLRHRCWSADQDSLSAEIELR